MREIAYTYAVMVIFDFNRPVVIGVIITSESAV